MFAALLTSVLFWQDPQPAPTPDPPKAEAEAEKPPAPEPVEEWDDRTAKAAATELAKVMKGKASMREKTLALDAVARGSHKLLVKPLANVVENDKSLLVRQRAALLLANQPAKDATPTVLKLIKNARVASHPAVQAELVKSLSRTGYTDKHWEELDDLFERDYAAERVPLQEAILELVATHKEKRALKLLLRNFDEPAPENEHDPTNPPAEYWEARWKAWSAWRSKVKDAVFAVTGQRFSTAAEAKKWLEKNPL